MLEKTSGGYQCGQPPLKESFYKPKRLMLFSEMR